MDANVNVEKLRGEDLPQVVALLNSLVPWEVSLNAAEVAFENMQASEDTAVLVAKENGAVIGTVTVVCSQVLAARFAAIEDVVVAPERTGRGIGSMLMEAADAFARARGCTYATVVSSGHRVRAHSFYEKCGFVEDVRGFRKGYKCVGERCGIANFPSSLFPKYRV